MKGSRFSHAVIAKRKWRALTYDTCVRYAQWLVLCHACTADFTAGRTARGLFVLILVNAGVIRTTRSVPSTKVYEERLAIFVRPRSGTYVVRPDVPQPDFPDFTAKLLSLVEVTTGHPLITLQQEFEMVLRKLPATYVAKRHGAGQRKGKGRHGGWGERKERRRWKRKV